MKVTMEIDLKGPTPEIPLERYELPEYDLLYMLAQTLRDQQFSVHGLAVRINDARAVNAEGHKAALAGLLRSVRTCLKEGTPAALCDAERLLASTLRDMGEER